ncbi:MAG: hypothetical protein U1E83_03715 [Methylotetracoccus sp.]
MTRAPLRQAYIPSHGRVLSAPHGSTARRVTTLFLLVAALSGCAMRHVEPQVAGSPAWWGAHFYIDWPAESEPRWYLDAMLAKEVVAPAFAEDRHAIPYWRVHRRALRDGGGHNFSFQFYAPPEAARRVFARLRGQPALADLLRRGRVLRVATDDPSHPGASAVAATSDPAWPYPLRQAWPSYIMGVSEFWLGLIDQLVAKRRGPRDEALYQAVQEELTELWAEWGQHALFHHASGVFAYRPIVIDRRVAVKF